MNILEEKLVILVINACKENPQFFKEIVDSALCGVKEFANKQQNFGAKLAFAMSDILSSDKDRQGFGHFSREELVELTKPWLEGTTWWKNEQKKLKS